MYDHLVRHQGVAILKPLGLMLTRVRVVRVWVLSVVASEVVVVAAAAAVSASGILKSTRFSRNAMSARLSRS